MNILYPLASVVIVSFISFVGLVGLGLHDKWMRKILLLLVSFAAGALLGDVFIHLLPDAAEKLGFTLAISFAVLAGIIASFIIEKFVHWHHCHMPEEHCEDDHEGHHHVKALGYNNLVGGSVHNFVDGIIIGASYLVNIEVGIATTVAVILHEIPRELGDYGILVHAGFSRWKAIWYNFLTACTAIVGTLLALFLPAISEKAYLLIPFAAGNFIYVAAADIIPELHKETETKTSALQLLLFILGILLMYGLLFIE